MKKLIKSLAAEEDGVTVIEYGLLAAMIAVAAFVAFQLIGDTLVSTFGGINSDIEQVNKRDANT